jgi:hypothetical protein
MELIKVFELVFVDFLGLMDVTTIKTKDTMAKIQR